jgi:hypothetical protein
MKRRNKLARQVAGGEISVKEALMRSMPQEKTRRAGQAPAARPAAAAAGKAARPGPDPRRAAEVLKSGPVPAAMWTPGQAALWRQYYESTDPGVRQRAAEVLMSQVKGLVL